MIHPDIAFAVYHLLWLVLVASVGLAVDSGDKQ